MVNALPLLTASFFALAFAVSGCAGKSLDVGTANDPGPAVAQPGEPPPPEPTPGPVAVGEIAGLWVMVRQDGVLGVPDAVTPPLELELTPDGVAYRSTCARPAGEAGTTPCPAASTFDCKKGTVRPEGARWRVDLPELRVGNVPEQGEVVTTTDGVILVRYINPTWSAGYFRRVGLAGQQGGCAR